MRPLPLSENGLKGLLNSQPQGPPEARAMGPGWGRCTAGKWSKAGKGKNKHSSFMAPDSEPGASREGSRLGCLQRPALPGHLACPPRERGRTRAGLRQGSGRTLMRPPEPIFFKALLSQLAHPSLSLPRLLRLLPLWLRGRTAVPGSTSFIQPSHWHGQLPQVTARRARRTGR